MKIITFYSKCSAIVCLMAIWLTHSLHAQDIRASLFNEADRTLVQAKKSQADILSPSTFTDGMKAYTQARQDYQNEKDLEDIRENLNEATQKFNEAIKNVELGTVVFSSALAARADARDANSASFTKDTWEEAEEVFRAAAEELEEGDADDAKEEAAEAEELYRKAELEAIEANYLANARTLVDQAEDNNVDKVAPRSLKQAKSLINLSEKALTENRYDTDEARYFAKDAEYQVRLAMYIAKKAEEYDDKDYEAEDYYIMAFEPLMQIGQSLDMNLHFDEGLEVATQEITDQINALQNENQGLTADLYERNQQNETLQMQLEEQKKLEAAMQGQMSEEVAQARERQEQLQARINRLAEIDNKFDQIQQIFGEEEALVFRQKNNVIIRLIGLNFDVGKAQIMQEDYALLTKLQQALKTFDNADIVIEGHTDSQGGDKINQTLSQERADAVLSYLSANTDIDSSRFKTQGYGESKPVSNNETSAGRQQNRRIDIVIYPDIDVSL